MNMRTEITLADLTPINGEPRILDLRLAEALGFERPRKIRELITRNINELEKYGEVCPTVGQTSPKGGRPSVGYHLNREQALAVSVLSDAPRAAEVRMMLIMVFVKYLDGTLTPVHPANSNAPAPIDETARKLAVIQEARMTKGPAYAARLWDNLGMPTPSEQLPTPTDQDAIACLRHLLRAEHQGLRIGQILRSAFRGERLAATALKDLKIEIKGDGFTVPNIHPAFSKLFDGTKWERPFEHLRRLPNVKPHLPYGGRFAGEYSFIPSTYLDEA